MKPQSDNLSSGISIPALAGISLTIAVVAAVATFLRMHSQILDEHSRESPCSDDVVIVQHSSISLPALSLEELVQRSDLIVSCTATDSRRTVLIKPVGDGRPTFFTDVTFCPDTIYANWLQENVDNSITVRSEGGCGDYVGMTVEGAPQFESSSRYLLFLTRVFDGTHYNTAGDHWYVVGVGSGAWTVEGDENFRSPYVLPSGDSLVDAASLEREIEQHDRSCNGAGRSGRRDGLGADLDMLERAHQEGRIPDTIYRQQLELAEKEGHSFARIMTPSEQEAYELGALAAFEHPSDSDVASSSL